MAPTVTGPAEGHVVDLAGLGVRFLPGAGRTGGGVALVERPIAPRTLGSPIAPPGPELETS